ncbi:MAG: hypothetical protein VX738_04530 [Planctomycetota bacterium]|nr:hypothetical protein [Planctomycetota bacterium]
MKTRTVYHKDGRIELKRVISADNLGHWNRDYPLAYERSIMWLKAIYQHPFVRVAIIRNARSRRGPLLTSSPKQIVLGYSKLTADAPLMHENQLCYLRRVFYVTKQDLYLKQPVDINQNCIRPASILPTIWGNRFFYDEPVRKTDPEESNDRLELHPIEG